MAFSGRGKTHHIATFVQFQGAASLRRIRFCSEGISADRERPRTASSLHGKFAALTETTETSLTTTTSVVESVAAKVACSEVWSVSLNLAKFGGFREFGG